VSLTAAAWGVVVDGCPPRLALTEADIQPTWIAPARTIENCHARKETDTVQILSGTFEGKTLGTPISMWVKNEDARPEAYSEMETSSGPRTRTIPITRSTASGTGRAGDERARVKPRPCRGGSDCKKDFARAVRSGSARLRQAGAAHRSGNRSGHGEVQDIESNIVRCPDQSTAEKMIRLIEKMRRAGDSVGGIVEGAARGVPAGWGEPVFDKLEADLAKAMMSLPASKAFEVGLGFGGIQLTGREHNDLFRAKAGKVRTVTNRSGGIQGGISNGETIYFRVASSLSRPSCTNRRPWTSISKIRS